MDQQQWQKRFEVEAQMEQQQWQKLREVYKEDIKRQKVINDPFDQLRQQVSIAQKMASGINKVRASFKNPVSSLMNNLSSLAIQFSLYVSQLAASTFIGTINLTKQQIDTIEGRIIAFTISYIGDVIAYNRLLWNIEHSYRRQHFQLIQVSLTKLNQKTVGTDGVPFYDNAVKNVISQIAAVLTISPTRVQASAIQQDESDHQTQLPVAEQKDIPVSEKVLSKMFLAIQQAVIVCRDQTIPLVYDNSKYAMVLGMTQVPVFMKLSPERQKKTVQFMNDKGQLVYQQRNLDRSQMSQQLQKKAKQNFQQFILSMKEIFDKKILWIRGISKKITVLSQFTRQNYVKKGRKRLGRKIQLSVSSHVCFVTFTRMMISIWQLFIRQDLRARNIQGYYLKIKLLTSGTYRQAFQYNVGNFYAQGGSTKLYYSVYINFLLQSDQKLLAQVLNTCTKAMQYLNNVTQKQLQQITLNQDRNPATWGVRALAWINKKGIKIKQTCNALAKVARTTLDNAQEYVGLAVGQVKQYSQRIFTLKKQTMQNAAGAVEAVSKKIENLGTLAEQIFNSQLFKKDLLQDGNREKLAAGTLQVAVYLNHILKNPSSYLYQATDLYQINKTLLQKMNDSTQKEVKPLFEAQKLQMVVGSKDVPPQNPAQNDRQLRESILTVPNLKNLQNDMKPIIQTQMRISQQRHEQIMMQLATLKDMNKDLKTTIVGQSQLGLKAIKQLKSMIYTTQMGHEDRQLYMRVMNENAEKIISVASQQRIQKQELFRQLSQAVRKVRVGNKTIRKSVQQLQKSNQEGQKQVIKILNVTQQDLKENSKGLMDRLLKGQGALKEHIQRISSQFHNLNSLSHQQTFTKLQGMAVQINAIGMLASGVNNSQVQAIVSNINAFMKQRLGQQMKYYISNLELFHKQQIQTIKDSIQSLTQNFGFGMNGFITTKISQLTSQLHTQYAQNHYNYTKLSGQLTQVANQVSISNSFTQRTYRKVEQLQATLKALTANNTSLPTIAQLNDTRYRAALITILKKISKYRQDQILKMTPQQLESSFSLAIANINTQLKQSQDAAKQIKEKFLQINTYLHLDRIDFSSNQWAKIFTKNLARYHQKMQKRESQFKRDEKQLQQALKTVHHVRDKEKQDFKNQVQTLRKKMKNLTDQKSELQQQCQIVRSKVNTLKRSAIEGLVTSQVRPINQPQDLGLSKAEFMIKDNELKRSQAQNISLTNKLAQYQNKITQYQLQFNRIRREQPVQPFGLSQSRAAQQMHFLRSKAVKLENQLEINNEQAKLKARIAILQNQNEVQNQKTRDLAKRYKDLVNQLQDMKIKETQILRKSKVQQFQSVNSISMKNQKITQLTSQVDRLQQQKKKNDEKLKRNNKQKQQLAKKVSDLQEQLEQMKKQPQPRSSIIQKIDNGSNQLKRMKQQLQEKEQQNDILKEKKSQTQLKIQAFIEAHEQVIQLLLQQINYKQTQITRTQQKQQILKKVKAVSKITSEFQDINMTKSMAKLKQMQKSLTKLKENEVKISKFASKIISIDERTWTIQKIMDIIQIQNKQEGNKDMKLNMKIVQKLLKELQQQRGWRYEFQQISGIVGAQLSALGGSINRLRRQIEQQGANPQSRLTNKLKQLKKEYKQQLQNFKAMQRKFTQLSNKVSQLTRQRDYLKARMENTNKQFIQPLQDEWQTINSYHKQIRKKYGHAKLHTLQQKVMLFALNVVAKVTKQLIVMLDVVQQFTQSWEEALQYVQDTRFQKVIFSVISLFLQIQQQIQRILQQLFEPQIFLQEMDHNQDVRDAWRVFKNELADSSLSTINKRNPKSRRILQIFQNNLDHSHEISRVLTLLQQQGRNQFQIIKKQQKKRSDKMQSRQKSMNSKYDSGTITKSKYQQNNSGRLSKYQPNQFKRKQVDDDQEQQINETKNQYRGDGPMTKTKYQRLHGPIDSENGSKKQGSQQYTFKKKGSQKQKGSLQSSYRSFVDWGDDQQQQLLSHRSNKNNQTTQKPKSKSLARSQAQKMSQPQIFANNNWGTNYYDANKTKNRAVQSIYRQFTKGKQQKGLQNYDVKDLDKQTPLFQTAKSAQQSQKPTQRQTKIRLKRKASSGSVGSIIQKVAQASQEDQNADEDLNKLYPNLQGQQISNQMQEAVKLFNQNVANKYQNPMVQQSKKSLSSSVFQKFKGTISGFWDNK